MRQQIETVHNSFLLKVKKFYTKGSRCLPKVMRLDIICNMHIKTLGSKCIKGFNKLFVKS